MAYLVLALGALLSIGGAFSIVHGYAIVEVERGWTGVIAGATALTGGIVTIALGLVLKTLMDLRTALRQPLMARAPVAETAPIDMAVPEPTAMDRATPHASESSMSLMTPELESGMLAAILSSRDLDVDLSINKTPAVEQAEAKPVHIDDLLETQRKSNPTEQPIDLAPGPVEDPGPVDLPGITDPPLEKPRFKVSFKRPAPIAPEPPRSPPLLPLDEHEAPAMDDWLDRALLALDHDVPPHPANGSHHADEPPPLPPAPPHEPEMAHAENTPEVAEAREEGPPPAPHYEPEPRPAPEPQPTRSSPPTSAVIGRYEADGTAYVMYADGSIEAHSDTGVARFNSMAELKAFIEGTA